MFGFGVGILLVWLGCKLIWFGVGGVRCWCRRFTRVMVSFGLVWCWGWCLVMVCLVFVLVLGLVLVLVVFVVFFDVGVEVKS